MPSSALKSEEHTSELQSLRHLVCRLLLEKKQRPFNATSEPEFFRSLSRASVIRTALLRHGQRMALTPPALPPAPLKLFFFNNRAPPEICSLSFPHPFPI